MTISPSEYAKFSKCAQIFSLDKHNYGCFLPYGWKIIDTKVDEHTDYTAIAFKNDKEIVIGHRGTDSLADLVADLELFQKKLPKDQLNSAYTFSEKVKNNNPEYNISHTGYSLGSTIAQLVAINNKAKAVVFDGPGVKEIAENTFGKEAVKNAGKDITIFLPYPNFINSINTHINNPFLVTYNSGVKENKGSTLLDFIHFTIAQHNIKILTSQFQDYTKDNFNRFECKWPSLGQAKEIYAQGKLSMFAKSEDCKKFMLQFDKPITEIIGEAVKFSKIILNTIQNEYFENNDKDTKAVNESLNIFNKLVNKYSNGLELVINILGDIPAFYDEQEEEIM